MQKLLKEIYFRSYIANIAACRYNTGKQLSQAAAELWEHFYQEINRKFKWDVEDIRAYLTQHLTKTRYEFIIRSQYVCNGISLFHGLAGIIFKLLGDGSIGT